MAAIVSSNGETTIQFEFVYKAEMVHETGIVTNVHQSLFADNPVKAYQKMEDMAEQWKAVIKCWEVKRLCSKTGELHNVFARAVPRRYTEEAGTWSGAPKSLGEALREAQDNAAQRTADEVDEWLGHWYNQSGFMVYDKPSKPVALKALKEVDNAKTDI